MSRTRLWNEAAEAMKDDPDPRWQAVGNWLRAEAWAHEAMGPMAELLNTAMEQETGVKSYLRFGRTPDGDYAFHADTNEGATAVATAYLNGPPSPRSSS